ncbi:DUF3592 domain-containing protein [Variovorax sp. Varisp85]|uniref:DUF3592 domain-containing protein n=1 Tax=Variovorax sp. Varisp85 TaxID=3243059 RepID=UPI0039A6D2B2
MTGASPSLRMKWLGAVLLAVGAVPMVVLAGGLGLGQMGACIGLMLLGSFLLCGGWDLFQVSRREAASETLDGRADGVIVASEMGGSYSDLSPLITFTVAFRDAAGVRHSVSLQKVIPLSELTLYGIGCAVEVRYAPDHPAQSALIFPATTSRSPSSSSS